MNSAQSKGPDPSRVCARFARCLESYEAQATIQETCGDLLLSLLRDYCGSRFSKVLEVGSCTGRMTEALSRDFDINTLSVNDLVPQLCASASSRVSALVPEVLELPGNIEEIPLPVGLDLIVSSSTFQWFCDYASSIHRMAEALLPGGNLVFSLFSKGTMMQVRSLTGVGITYLSDEELLGPLKADLDLLHFETVKHSLFFENPREVLRHIQDTGVSGVADFHWTVAALRRFERQYVERFGTMRGVSLDYVSRFVVARKKGRGQS